jgi:pimeloyl-ACP methyl ester carboxylesterase
MFQQKEKFKNSIGATLTGVFEGENRDAPLVIMCHGYGSSKDKLSTKGLAQKLVERRLSVFRFDFTGCGESEGALEDSTPLRGLGDLKSAVKFLGREKFALYGSSFGGYVALLYAAKHPVLTLGLKAPVSDYMEVETKRSDQNYGFTPKKKAGFLKEVKDIDIYSVAGKIKVPTFIVHGDADPVVPVGQSKKLLKYLGGEKELSILLDAGHVMNDEDLEKANALIADFFQEKLLTNKPS